MAEIIRMPRMSDTMEEGVIVEWLKQEGDEVEPGDILAEVETDKATMELENYHEGILLHIGVKEGPVPVDGIIAVIGEEGEDYKAVLEAEKGSGSGSKKSDEEESVKNEDQADQPKEHKEEKVAKEESTSTSDKQLKASPLARKIASDEGIALTDVQGSGPEGRIIKADVEKILGGKKDSGVPATQSKRAPVAERSFVSGETKEIPVTQMRKTIARRLAESKFGAPHFYLTSEINMDKTVEARTAFNALGDGKVTFNDIVVKATALALKKHPMINSSWLGDKIRINGDINIGVAVAVDDGLLVPVVKNADQKSLFEINAEVRDKATRSRDKKLSLDEMQGNTFSISNLGAFDIDQFTAIINPPDAAILAIGSIRKVPIVNDQGEIVPGNLMKVCLSCDHRVIDGATGANFLQTLKRNLENPLAMLA